MRCILITALATLGATLGAAERINQEGRLLGPAPVVTTPTVFNTPEADAIVAAMQIMPVTNAWNEDISGRPVAANSATMITNISDDVFTHLAGEAHANRRRLVVFEEMNYVLVPDTQALVDINFFGYPDESDDLKPVGPGNNPAHIGSWPIPANMPIETWPTGDGLVNTAQGLVDWQKSAVSGDRHSIVVMPGSGFIWETWTARLTTGWRASNGAKFPLTSDTPLRTDGWTSGDAAGLPMFPALVRFDECARGVVEHAMRIVVQRSRQAHIYPATHDAGSTTNVDYPAMGQRLRLKSSFSIPGSWSAQEKAVATALKKYGALVADNGSFFSVSICPDHRWPSGCWDHFSQNAASGSLDIGNFEVITATGATEGPRAANPPTAAAGGDQSVTLVAGSASVSLSGTISHATSATWSLYDATHAPAGVGFSSVSTTSTQALATATFTAAGVYTLLLKAADTTHAPAYDALVVTVLTGGGSNPAPTLTTLSPAAAVSGAGGFTMTLTGNSFMPTSTVHWSGQSDLAIGFITSSQITVQVPSGYITSAGTANVTVENSTPGGGATSAQVFTITAPSGSSGGGGASAGGGGGCGLGSAAAALLLALLLALHRLR